MTGGSSGIGQAIAVRMAREGANVAINYLRASEQVQETTEKIEKALEESVAECRRQGVDTTLLQGDVSREKDVEELVRQTAWSSE